MSEIGAATLWLTASNGFTGGTTISAGTLGFGNTNALQGSSVTDNSPAANVLTFAASGTTYNVAGLSGSGNLALPRRSAAAA